jgi:hypothetical protein
MERLGQAFPQGLEWGIPFDTTLFIEQSIAQVYQTLIEAAIIVFVVIFIFLGNWRAAVIPGVAIPVSLIGTAAAMAALGFSINMISLFGLVLAIGIVVDDAIVVVENVSKKMEEGLSGKEAAIKGMAEITGPVIATTLVLIAVFVPTAFLPGISGQLYRHRFQLHQRPDHESGPVCAHFAPAPEGKKAKLFLARIQPRIRCERERLRTHRGRNGATYSNHGTGLYWTDCAFGLESDVDSHRVFAHRRPGLCHCRLPTAGCRLPGARA